MRNRTAIMLAAALAALLALSATANAAPEPLEAGEAARLLAEVGGPDDYPDSESVYVFDRTLVEFEKSGAYREYSHELVKLITDEGIDRHADVSLTYHRRYGSVEILVARVIKADGTVVDVGEDLMTDGTPPELSAMNIYETDFRQRTIVFPGLEVGDGIEMLILSDYSKPLIENGFAGIYPMQSISPMVESSLTIQGPSDMPLHHIAKGAEIEFEESDVVEAPAEGRGDDWGYYRWTARNVPQIDPEPGMPSGIQIANRVIVSTMKEWEELSHYLWKICDDKCEVDSSVRDKVAEITEGLETTEEKIKAIHYWIAKNVRYLGVSMDRGAFLEPHKASYTLEKEYGICRDKAVLMTAMLEEIGVPAWIVAINVSRKTDTEIPTVFFEHGIVAIEGPDGEYRYIDPTQETSREVYANYVGDRWTVVATEEGTDIQKVPHISASDNAGRVTDTSEIDDEGGITGTMTVTGKGMYESTLREIAKAAREEELRNIWKGFIQDFYPGAEMTSFEVTDYQDLDVPLLVTAEYSADDYIIDADPYLLFRIPAATGSFDFLSSALFGRLTGMEERTYPLAIGVTIGSREEAETLLPSGYTVESLPDDVDFQEGPIGLSISYEFVPAAENGGRAAVRYEKELMIDSFQIEPDAYISLKEAVKKAGNSTRGEVILKREEG